MLEMNECLPLGADVMDPRTCSDAEHFSGYIITTSSNTR